MTSDEIRRKWLLLPKAPGHPEDDPIDIEVTLLNFAADHFDELLIEIGQLRNLVYALTATWMQLDEWRDKITKALDKKTILNELAIMQYPVIQGFSNYQSLRKLAKLSIDGQDAAKKLHELLEQM